ncbi:Hypothetical protein, putative [Bodo saltans]|uniref:Uncharacterized protein n=1 Tax=Bodo saltans TaxID=75058 RepID=A0A0S4J8I9_BODSA|nr:Hypothetical protein, putative [Bodo saltans]|eukprot:CUG87724.1 Hypothetical protein, putative [Bodo saltans]
MRQRRGLSPRTQLSVAQLTTQDIDDMLNSMPFLAPILPVPQSPTGGHMSHRTPRKQSGKMMTGKMLTPRGSFVRHGTMNPSGGGGTHTPRGSIGGMQSARDLINGTGGGVTPGSKPSNAPPMSTSGPPAEAFRLTAGEVELATRAWLQILDSSGGQSNDGEGGGGSGSPAKNNAASAANQQSLAFARACTDVAHLHEGRQLQAILRQLHVPVLPVIGDLLDQVVELSSGGTTSSSAMGSAARPSMHFFRFLKFLCECKHLTSILRHHKRVVQKQRQHWQPPASRTSYNHASQPMVDGMVNEDEAAIFGGGDGGDDMDALEMEDIRATYEYLQSDAALQQLQQQAGGGSPQEGESSSSPRVTIGTTSGAAATAGAPTVTAAMVTAFAERFDLSLASVLPPEYLVTHTTPAAGRSVSTPPPTSMDHLLGGFDPFSSSLRGGNGSQGSLRMATGPPPPKPKATLIPTMAMAEISLDIFAQHVGDDSSHNLGVEDTTMFDGFASPYGSPALLSRVASHQGPGSLAPLRLGAVSAPLVNELKDGTRSGTTRGGGGGAHGGMASPTTTTTVVDRHSTLLTLQPFATHAETHNRLSTIMLPPVAYTKFEEHKLEKREKERNRREREARLREEYLYGPPRPKPRKQTVDEISTMLLREATELAESLPPNETGGVHHITSKIRSSQRERLKAEEKEANRYAFMLGSNTSAAQKHQRQHPQPVAMSQAVRKATAQEILAMLQRCPQDSVLGTQSSMRQEQRLRGMNGLDTTASSIARSRSRQNTSGQQQNTSASLNATLTGGHTSLSGLSTPIV